MAFCCIKPNTTDVPTKAKRNNIRRSENELLQTYQDGGFETGLMTGMTSLAFSDIQLDTDSQVYSKPDLTSKIKQVNSRSVTL